MVVRLFAALIIVVMGNELLAQQNDATARVGDVILIKMTGDVARDYARRIGSLPEIAERNGLEIQTTAMIAQQLDGGRFRIEHYANVNHEGKTVRLVTLTGIVDPAKITSAVTAKGTSVSASPQAKPVLITEDMKTFRLELSDLKEVKLRTWTMVEEIGD
jgi:hypothetical protein